MWFFAPFALFGTMGLLGVASLILTLGPILDRLRSLPNPPARSDFGLIVLALAQPTILVLLTIMAGVLLADRVGLRSHLLAWTRGLSLPARFGSGVPMAIVLAIVVGTAIIMLDLVFKEITDPGSVGRLGAASGPPNWTVRASAILYGGITEELMMRFGLMTLLVWLASLVFPGALTCHPGLPIGAAIVISALLFGLGHLPQLFASTRPSTALILHIVVLNTLAGLVYGWLYWRHSLEHAMLAHALTHLTFWTVTPVLLQVGAALTK
ncbi:MAG TPA: CPBP family intramembrane glutamic endopeptidase [Microvirga sp.]|jgi:hypothetical protein|nr:CPBP family intramembrane glutamic endopeptidase [Microvirga sp.]